MVSLGEFIVQLLMSIVELLVTFITDVLLSSPISAILLIVGGLLIGGASLVVLYLALGALAKLFGGFIGSPAGGQH